MSGSPTRRAAVMIGAPISRKSPRNHEMKSLRANDLRNAIVLPQRFDPNELAPA